MKKTLCILLTLALLTLTAVPALADDSIALDASYTDSIGRSVSEWYDTSLDRAFLTWMLLLDYAVAGNSVSDVDMSSASYVGKYSSDSLMVSVCIGNGKYVCFCYSPSVGSCHYVVTNATASQSGNALNQVCLSCYTNSTSDLETVAGVISEYLND